MSRLPRIDLPFCLYHVFSRTIGLRKIDDIAFHDVKDQNKFLEYVERYSRLFSFRIQAWCLMSTHFHILLETTDQRAISEFMRRLLTAYTVYFNRRHGRHGHLFQGRFHSLIIDKATHLLAVSRYIHLNPANTSKPVDPETYSGSSLKYYLKGSEPSYLFTQETLDWFGGNRSKYREFIKKGMTEETAMPIHFRRFVGDTSFAERMMKRLGASGKRRSQSDRANRLRKEMKRQQADTLIKIVSKYFEISPQAITSGSKARGIRGLSRIVSCVLLRENLPWTYREIADYMNLHWIGSVTRNVLEKAKTKDVTRHLRIIKRRYHKSFNGIK